jgi:hypothetical protein
MSQERAATRVTTRSIHPTFRGQLTDDDVTAFLEAGFEKEHSHPLGVIAVVAASTITNYAGKMTNPPQEAIL